jgi:hypothetical protein
MHECVELYQVWVAFGVGFFIGGIVGAIAICILNMARDQETWPCGVSHEGNEKQEKLIESQDGSRQILPRP